MRPSCGLNYRWVRAITERFGRVNFGRLEIEVTVDDPKVYTKPWTVKISQMFQPDTDSIVLFARKKDRQHIDAAVKEVVK